MTIESGIPVPVKVKAVVTRFGVPIDLDKTLNEIQPRQSFIVDTQEMRRYAIKRAHDKGVKVTSKQEEGRYRIWRTV